MRESSQGRNLRKGEGNPVSGKIRVNHNFQRGKGPKTNLGPPKAGRIIPRPKKPTSKAQVPWEKWADPENIPAKMSQKKAKVG